jgi:hypothetical protein
MFWEDKKSHVASEGWQHTSQGKITHHAGRRSKDGGDPLTGAEESPRKRTSILGEEIILVGKDVREASWGKVSILD